MKRGRSSLNRPLKFCGRKKDASLKKRIRKEHSRAGKHSGMAVFDRRERLIAKVSDFIREHHLIVRGDRVIAGVSGGADSVCLLFCLKALSEKEGFELHAVHVHHGIRGREADEDECFVREMAEKLQVPYKAFFEDAPAFAAAQKRSEEEAGRILRKRAFADYIREIGAARAVIALAHHRDDLAETVIFQLARGSGLAGLAGIRPKVEDGNITVVRPLLGVSRGEIETFLREKEIPWRTDRTNLTDAYTRNRIRHHVLPYLEKEIHGGAAAHIAANALLAGDALAFIEEEAAKRSRAYVKEKDGVCLSEKVFSEETPFMVSYILRLCLQKVSPHQQDITAKHIEDLRHLAGTQNGKRIDLPGNLTAERTYEGLRFFKKELSEKAAAAINETLAEGKSAVTPEWTFRCGTDPEIRLPIPEKTYTKWIDFAIIADELRVRTRRPGDFITVRADGARKKLSDFMTDVKMPHSLRDRLPLVADGQEIIWIPGYRLNERYKVTEKTGKVLRIEAVCNTGHVPYPIDEYYQEKAGENEHE